VSNWPKVLTRVFTDGPDVGLVLELRIASTWDTKTLKTPPHRERDEPLLSKLLYIQHVHPIVSNGRV